MSNSFALRRAHRVRILVTLADICSSLERLQTSEEARQACREVGRLLSNAAAPGRKTARRHAKAPHSDR